MCKFVVTCRADVFPPFRCLCLRVVCIGFSLLSAPLKGRESYPSKGVSLTLSGVRVTPL